MTFKVNRRDFLKTTAAAGVAARGAHGG